MDLCLHKLLTSSDITCGCAANIWFPAKRDKTHAYNNTFDRFASFETS
jgi:hypothetical protein